MPRVRRTATLLLTSTLAISAMDGCSYLFPSCATIPGCPAGQVLCTNLSCSDLRTDPFNCGTCWHACGAGLSCDPDAGVGADGGIVGACVCPIEGQTLVDGRCLALSIDPDNCGAVDHACRLDQACVDGGCGCLIPSYLDGGSSECDTDAGPVCADLLSDPENCGGCGRICAADCQLGVCDGGVSDGGLGDAGDAGGGDAGDGG
jgi:hypothetical protein